MDGLHNATFGGLHAVVTLSLGSRPFVRYTHPLMQAYAERIGAAFHIVAGKDHAALHSLPLPRATQRMGRSAAASARFQKLPLLHYFLERYARVLYLDDDVLVGPRTPDLFLATPPSALAATIENHKPQAWHAMHWRSACELYGVGESSCSPNHWKLFNSGVMLLSRATHAPLLAAGWRLDASRLQCRVLCDQLYLNALLKREGGMVHDLGASFNFVGSEFRRALVTSTSSLQADHHPSRQRRAALRHACLLHLTRKVPKLYVADWVTHRSLSPNADVLQCTRNASSSARDGSWKRRVRSHLPSPLPPDKYDIRAELCRGEPQPCELQPWLVQHAAKRSSRLSR
jgi:hypothetical protein